MSNINMENRKHNAYILRQYAAGRIDLEAFFIQFIDWEDGEGNDSEYYFEIYETVEWYDSLMNQGLASREYVKKWAARQCLLLYSAHDIEAEIQVLKVTPASHRQRLKNQFSYFLNRFIILFHVSGFLIFPINWLLGYLTSNTLAMPWYITFLYAFFALAVSMTYTFICHIREDKNFTETLSDFFPFWLDTDFNRARSCPYLLSGKSWDEHCTDLKELYPN